MTLTPQKPILLALSALLCGALACASLGPGDVDPTDAPEPTEVFETEAPEPTEEEPIDEPTEEPTEEEPTEEPTAEEPTEAPVGGGEVLFEDDFAFDNERWTIGDEGSSIVSIHDGVLDIEIIEEQYMGWSHLYDDEFSDVRIAFDAEPRNDDDQPSWGVVCNYADPANFYYMSFGADGYYAIARYLDDEYLVLSDEDGNYVESQLIQKGKSSYRVEALCAYGVFELWVDGKRIAAVEDDALTGGTVGLLLETFDGNQAQVLFDNVVVTSVD
ncbi:MAG TPA: hypothetical protein PLC98_12620 [Anaerolineales bacterium]|nr:hypothetical protein [Anaerolineales bacterium]